MKRRSKGRSEESTEIADCGCCASAWWDVSPGRRRGRCPPNWCTRKPGPPPKLKTNCGPASKPERTLLVGSMAGTKTTAISFCVCEGVEVMVMVMMMTTTTTTSSPSAERKCLSSLRSREE